MSYPTRQAATAAARRVLKRMKTRGWKIEVWENLGWQWHLCNFRLRLIESRWASREPQYWCLLASDDRVPGGGNCIWTKQSGLYAEDPNIAVEAQMRHAEEVVRELHSSLQGTRLHLRYGRRAEPSKKALPFRRRAVR